MKFFPYFLGKTIKFTHLFPQLNKKYNYNDIADLSNTSTLNLTSPEKQNKDEKPQENSEKVDTNNNINTGSEIFGNKKVKDWLSTKEDTNLNIDRDDQQLDDIALLDTTQQIDNRHTLLLHNRSTRTSQYDRMSNANIAAKIRSHSADSRNNKRETTNDEEENESFTSCVEEILSRSRSRSSSSIHSGQCFKETDTNKKSGKDAICAKDSKCTFDYDPGLGCLASTMTTIQPSNDQHEVKHS